MTPEPTVRSRLHGIVEGPVRDLPTPEETLKAKAKAKADWEKAAKGRASQSPRPWLFGRKVNRLPGGPEGGS
jgi:hypothetical protein